MSLVDKTRTCVDCGEPFTFSAGEQEFFQRKGFQNDPKRCKACKAQKRVPGNGHTREQFDAVCGDCGQKTTVPFKPTNGRPVYCRACFEVRQAAGRR